MNSSDPTINFDLRKYALQRARIAGSALLGDEHPYFKSLDVLEARAKERAGGNFVSFANYDYLGLCRDPRLIRAATEATQRLGIGASASRLVGGQREVHDELERDISRFLGIEDSLVLVSGYMTNASLIGHLLTKRDVIFVDEYSHNSIMVGADISRADIVKFDHNDLDHLERLLAESRSRYCRALVVVEGLYSMDGDIADLPRLIALKERYGFWIMLDEAHSIGVLGATGRGLTEHWGVDPGEVDFIIGTLSKSFASVGGFIGGRSEVIGWLRFTLPAFVYSVGLPPMIAAAVRTALAIVDEEGWRVAKVQENSRYFAEGATRRGLDIGLAAGAGVIPILFYDPYRCMQAAAQLVEAGYYAPPIVQVAVPRGQPRIRCFVTCAHTREEMDGFLDAVAATGLAAAPSRKIAQGVSKGRRELSAVGERGVRKLARKQARAASG
jgi:8-amino-7-oxononanoate synthase